jgi:predicted DNA-binding transcriptional regulator AlpA
MHQPLILSAFDAARVLSVSERKFHALRQTPGFPQPLELGPRCLRWRVSDLEGWLHACPTIGAQAEPVRIRLARDARRQGGESEARS